MPSTRWRSQPTMGSSRHAATSRLLTRPLPNVPIPLPNVPIEEWRIILTERPNVLIEGNESVIEATIVRFVPHLRPEIHWWHPGRSLLLPLGGGRTLVLRDVAALESEDQMRLLEWLQGARSRGTQVVSTGTTALFSGVQQGTFLADLYYRLNMLRLDLDQL
jgi:hypothetical protein